jgi:hypothetical protein
MTVFSMNEAGLQICSFVVFKYERNRPRYDYGMNYLQLHVVTMLQSYLLLTLLLSASGSIVANSIHDPKTCREFTLPVDVTSINYIWGLPQLQTNYDAAIFNSELGRWDANVTLNPISGGAQISESYRISGTFCAPTHGGNGIVLVATHSFGFDRRYEYIHLIFSTY